MGKPGHCFHVAVSVIHAHVAIVQFGWVVCNLQIGQAGGAVRQSVRVFGVDTQEPLKDLYSTDIRGKKFNVT